MCILTVFAFGDHKVSTRGMRLLKIVKTRDRFNQNNCMFVDKLNNLFSKIVIKAYFKETR